MLKGNKSYTLQKELGNVRIYTLTNTMELHTTRYVELLNQQIYSSSGANKDILEQTMNEILTRCNDMKNQKTFRTDVAALANSVLYRLKYPVDQHCAIRMGAMCCFYEEDILNQDGSVYSVLSEDKPQFDAFFQQKKEMLALSNPEWYSFFLSLGIVNTPQYNTLLDTLTDTDYFRKREETIQAILPSNQPTN